MLAGLIPGRAAAAAETSAEERLAQDQRIMAGWHTYSGLVALKLMDEYGPPDQVESERIVWHNAGPWDTIVVWDADDYDYSATLGPDNLEQTLFFAVPPEKRKALADFSDELTVSGDGKELSVRGHSEELNFLALNLAYEIVQGFRDPAEARIFYDRTCQLAQAGKSSPYLRGLMFIR